MVSSSTGREAKEFLIRCVVEEAQREGIPFTDVEHDMLYFSETHWTLPNFDQVNAAFEREYDSAAYEQKVCDLIRNFKARARRENPALLEQWERAVAAIASEDHYLLVMIAAAQGGFRSQYQLSGLKRFVKLLAIGMVAGIAAILIMTLILFVANR